MKPGKKNKPGPKPKRQRPSDEALREILMACAMEIEECDNGGGAADYVAKSARRMAEALR